MLKVGLWRRPAGVSLPLRDHATSEVRILADTGTAVAHCPCSNMKLASGSARIGALRTAGVTVGLGSDGEKENNNLDLLEEMKFASLLQKVSTLDPTAGDPAGWPRLDRIA